MSLRPLPLLILASLLVASASARAQEPESTPEAQAAVDNERPPLLSDEQALHEEATPVEERDRGIAPHEEPGVAYNFLGAFYEHHFVPEAILEIFTDQGPSFDFPAAGLEYIRRKDGRDVIARLYYAQFSGQGAFLAQNDPPAQLEWIDADLFAVMGSVTFLWSTRFSDWFALQVGVGVGLGVLLGDLHRTEAYPTADGAAPCVAPTAPGQPGTAQPGQPYAGGPGTDISQYCGTPSPYPSTPDGQDGEHYGVRARRWAQGGMVPNIWFRASPQVALRFKPIRQLVLRIDGGFDVFSGFFVGGALAVGL